MSGRCDEEAGLRRTTGAALFVGGDETTNAQANTALKARRSLTRHGSRASDPVRPSYPPYSLKILQSLQSTGSAKTFLHCVSEYSQQGLSGS